MEIIFGLNTPLKQIQSIMNLMLQLGYKNVIYRQIILRNNEFKIHFAELKYEPKLNAVLKIGLTEDSKKITFSILNPYWEEEKRREDKKRDSGAKELAPQKSEKQVIEKPKS